MIHLRPPMLFAKNFKSWAYGFFVTAGFACSPDNVAYEEAGAQMVTEVIGVAADSSCPFCRAQFSHVVTLGTPDGPGAVESEITLVSKDSQGRYYARPEYGSTIKVYARDGRFLKAFGRRGAGPGEFRMISAVEHTRGDTIHVFDTGNVRRSVFSPQQEYLYSHPLEIRPVNQVLLLSNDNAVFGTSVLTADLAGYPLHLVNDSGRLVRSFGSVTRNFDARVPYSDERVLSAAGDSAVWATYRNHYRIELWPVYESDVPFRVLERNVSWFPPLAATPETAEEPPAPRLQAISDDGRGNLLVLSLVADDSWRGAVRGGASHPEVTDWQEYYDSLVEVIKIESAEVVASVRSPIAFHRFVDGRTLSAVTFDDGSVPRVELWEVTWEEVGSGTH